MVQPWFHGASGRQGRRFAAPINPAFCELNVTAECYDAVKLNLVEYNTRCCIGANRSAWGKVLNCLDSYAQRELVPYFQTEFVYTRTMIKFTSLYHAWVVSCVK